MRFLKFFLYFNDDFFTRAGHHSTSGHVRVLPCSGHRDRADLRGGRGRITTTILSLPSSSGREICRCEYFYTRTHAHSHTYHTLFPVG